MFRIESYITPIIWSYFSKYVKNFNSHDFQVSLWNGGAVFSNLELNLDVLDSELQIPLTFASGHIQELKITVPWRKITSEPIVLNVKSMELVLKYKDVDGEPKAKKSADEIIPARDVSNRDDENAGYMRGLIAKIVTNVRVNFENVVIKYVESDIAFSVNVGEASMTAADENWKDTFLDRVAYSPDFILRKKLSFSDVNICLDRCNNAGVVDKFQDPMLYRCDFDVRIIQKFHTTYSRIPYFYRMDLFLGHLQFCVTDEQIPMLVRLYNLFTFLMQSADTSQDELDETVSSLNDTGNETTESDSLEQAQDKVQSEDRKETDANAASWTSWAAGWLYTIPSAVFGDDEDFDLEDVLNDKHESSEEKTKPPTPPPLPATPSAFTGGKSSFSEGFQFSPPTTHFGVYIKTLTIIFKAVQRSCDKPHFSRRKIISIYPFLKCSIQGICCDFIMRGNENSHALGVSSIMVHGLGFCPCGVHDCSSAAGGLPSQGGECYFEAGKIMQEFSASSLFQPDGVDPPEWCYDVNHKDCLNYQSESALLDKTPAFFLKYIVTRSDVDKNNQNLQNQNPEISEILYHCVTAPCKVLLCSGLLHRLKMIHNGIVNYGYKPLGFEHLAVSIARYGSFSPEMKYPLTTYRLVIRQPLIEILAADHPSDYSPEKRAEYFRRSGGLVVPPTTLPRLSPDWPRMIISCDMLECTAVDADDHFFKLRNRFLGEPSIENSVNNNAKNGRHRRKSQPQGEELTKWMNQKTEKRASLKFVVMEVLLSFVSEPVELNIGMKSGVLELEFENNYIYSLWEILQRSKGNIYMDSVTCSTRLQQRSNVLWLPFTIKVDTLFDWEPTLLSPSLAMKVSTSSLTLFVGPETLIAFSQLNEKLTIYLQEFLPRAVVDSQLAEASAIPSSTRMSIFVNSFDNADTELYTVTNDIHCIPEAKKGIGICPASQSVIWKYPQKRTLRALAIEKVPFPFPEGNGEPFVKFHVEYCEDFTKQFHNFCSFTLTPGSPGRGRIARFANELERHAISATVWRLRLESPENQPNVEKAVLEALAKTIIVESIHFPELSLMMEFCEVNLNLVNNTFYTGKEIGIPALQSYLNTDGVSPDDHIMATLHFKQSSVHYSAVDKIARFNADFVVDLKVLDYESLVLEEIVEPVFVGLVMMVPDVSGNCSLNLVTDSVNLKIGASMVHSITYSSALWYQVINSFDPRLCKMVATETQSKIILNRILMCNDLNTEIQLNCSHPESLGGDKIPSRDCKAVSFLSPHDTSTDFEKPAQLYLSCGEIPDSEVEIDIYKSGYSVKKLCDNKVIFVNVSSLTSSQKLVKVSGPLILANGLDQAVEISTFPYSSVQAVKSVLPSRGIGPTYLYSIDEIEHFRFRFMPSSLPGSSQCPWSDVVYTNDLIKAEGAPQVSSVLVPLFQQSEHSIYKTQVWLTLVPEQLKGENRYLLVVSPIYCLRSWLCGDTFVHLSSENTTDMYSLKGKGNQIQIKFEGEGDVAHHMKFQSNLNVPPSVASVPLLPSGPMLEKTKSLRPIDEILVQITNTPAVPNAEKTTQPVEEDAALNLKWPFIAEDIETSEWNTEINPETEIMVSFTPWVEGLPTAVADVRPWALFINLSGVELLFSQEVTSVDAGDDGSDWDQFWVPYKCVFSPKPIKIPSGKFRLGIMMNDFLVKSPPLQFSDQPERLSVKKINKDGKVPIDCFSRLDLFGGSQVACLTIETRVQNKILVVTVRPTYSIQNRAPFEVCAEGVTISSAVPQRRESWTDARLSMFSTLEPFKTVLSGSSGSLDDMACTAMPILHFTTDGQDYSASTPSYKYLALSCGGPWWFVQLVDCSESSHASEGIPGTKIAVTLPKVDCSVLSPLFRHKLKTFKVATEAVVVGSYTKNGQVWVSISQDNAPQVMFHNKSTLPLFYAEKAKNQEEPKHHTSCFEQYLMVPPKSSCHFSFAHAYSIFPQLNKRESSLPDLMMAEVSQDLVDFVTSHQTQNFVTVTERPRHKNKSGASSTSSTVSKLGGFRYPSGNMLFPDFDIEWQRVTSVNSNPTQYAKFGKQSVKISVEIVGYTHHVFIENTNMKEVSAKTVRSRFSNRNSIKPPIPMIKPEDAGSNGNVSSHTGHTAGMLFSTNYDDSPRDVTITIGDLDDDEEEEVLPIAMVEPGATANKPYQQWRIKALIPELYVSIQDDFDCVKEMDREFLGLAFEPIILEQIPIIEDSKLRPAECPRRESWIYACRIGNMQVDTPSIPTKRPAEFSVLLQPVKKADKKLYAIPTSSLDVASFMDAFIVPTVLNIDSTITITRVASDEINLETVWLKVLPFSLYVEDRLLSYVLPSVQSITAVFNEGYILMEKCAAAGTSSLAENESQTQPIIDPGIIRHISIVDSGPSVEYPSLFYADHELNRLSGVPGHKRSFGNGSGSGNVEAQSLFSSSITFAPTQASSSSGLNSSSSSVISSSVSNLRLASVSPPPPSPMTPLEPHGSSSRITTFQSLMTESASSMTTSLDQAEVDEDNTSDPFAVSRVPVPKELIKLFEQLSRPLRVKVMEIHGSELQLTLRTEKVLYVALDRSVVQLRPFRAYSSVTTDFHLALELTMHYTVGTIFTIGNPVRVLGSLELLGSPGTLARTVGTGLRDLVVYPYEGILNGPVGFVSGLGYGMTSLLRSVTSGTLVSLTNWAESVSRNIDRLTLDQQEQLISEAERQVELQGFTDGFVHGLSGFGIRILGAIGGLTHHPIKNVIHRGPTTSSVISGVGRGVIGVVVKPIGGVAELISMTGQGVLLATGWKPKPKVKKPKNKKSNKVRKSSSESS